MLSRVRGSLVAAVVGDCIGEMFEGAAYVSIQRLMREVNKIEQKWSDSEQKGRLGQLNFTDDTAMARSIAASLVEHRSVNVKDIADRFAREFARESSRGYGGNVVVVLKALGDSNLTDLYRPASQQFDGRGSYGNGGGMRIAPLGLFFYKQPLDELKEYTEKITKLTHSHPEGIVGAILQSFAVQMALSLNSQHPLDSLDFLQKLLECLKPVEREVNLRCQQTLAQKEGEAEEKGDQDKSEKQELPYCTKLEQMKELLTRDVSVDEVEQELGNDIAALRSIPTAVFCFLKAASLSIPEFEGRSEVEKTILYAISLGGDTDTIATMAGAIAGAFYGLEAIPQTWQDACEGVQDAIHYADAMLDIFKNTGRA